MREALHDASPTGADCTACQRRGGRTCAGTGGGILVGIEARWVQHEQRLAWSTETAASSGRRNTVWRCTSTTPASRSASARCSAPSRVVAAPLRQHCSDGG